MKLKFFCFGLGTILALGGNLGAQESASRWSVSASAGLSTDSLNMITNSGTAWWQFGAFNFDVGYRGMIAESGVPFRASIGINHCPAGREGIALNSNATRRGLMGYYIAGDMFFDSKIVDNLYFMTGFSVNSWSLTESTDSKSETRSVEGFKFGGRLGLEYKISDNLAFNAIFQVVELGTNRSHLENPATPDYSYTTGGKRWNPSWLQFGLKYTF